MGERTTAAFKDAVKVDTVPRIPIIYVSIMRSGFNYLDTDRMLKELSNCAMEDKITIIYLPTEKSKALAKEVKAYLLRNNFKNVSDQAAQHNATFEDDFKIVSNGSSYVIQLNLIGELMP